MIKNTKCSYKKRKGINQTIKKSVYKKSNRTNKTKTTKNIIKRTFTSKRFHKYPSKGGMNGERRSKKRDRIELETNDEPSPKHSRVPQMTRKVDVDEETNHLFRIMSTKEIMKQDGPNCFAYAWSKIVGFWEVLRFGKRITPAEECVKVLTERRNMVYESEEYKNIYLSEGAFWKEHPSKENVYEHTGPASLKEELRGLNHFQTEIHSRPEGLLWEQWDGVYLNYEEVLGLLDLKKTTDTIPIYMIIANVFNDDQEDTLLGVRKEGHHAVILMDYQESTNEITMWNSWGNTKYVTYDDKRYWDDPYANNWDKGEEKKWCNPSTRDSLGNSSLSSCKARCDAQGTSSCPAITYYQSDWHRGDNCFLCSTNYKARNAGIVMAAEHKSDGPVLYTKININQEEDPLGEKRNLPKSLKYYMDIEDIKCLLFWPKSFLEDNKKYRTLNNEDKMMEIIERAMKRMEKEPMFKDSGQDKSLNKYKLSKLLMKAKLPTKDEKEKQKKKNQLEKKQWEQQQDFLKAAYTPLPPDKDDIASFRLNVDAKPFVPMPGKATQTTFDEGKD